MAALHETGNWEVTRVTLRDLAHVAHMEWRVTSERLFSQLTRKQLDAVHAVGGSYYDQYSYLQTARVSGRIKDLAVQCEALLRARERTAHDYHTWCDQDV